MTDTYYSQWWNASDITHLTIVQTTNSENNKGKRVVTIIYFGESETNYTTLGEVVKIRFRYKSQIRNVIT